MIKNAIETYYKQIKPDMDYCKGTDFSDISEEIKKLFDNGRKPVRKTEVTDLTPFQKEFGTDVPAEIEKYINEYWHPCIYGYQNLPECIVLFSVLKKEEDTADDVVFYKNSLMDLSSKWSNIGDINKYIPIGWLNDSGGFVLYNVDTFEIYIEDVDSNKEGEIAKVPIADSLEDLILNLKIM